MVALNWSFHSIDSLQLRKLLHMLHHNLDVPSANLMKSQLKDQAGTVRGQIRKDLSANSKVSIALDAWSSPNHLAFLAIVAYYIDKDWNYHQQLIGFERLEGEHSGDRLSDTVLTVLETYDLESRLLAITTDNASNNTTLAESLQEKISEVVESGGFLAESSHIPCLAHVVQLSVKAFLDGIKISATNDYIMSSLMDNSVENVRTTRKGFQRTLLKVSPNLLSFWFEAVWGFCGEYNFGLHAKYVI